VGLFTHPVAITAAAVACAAAWRGGVPVWIVHAEEMRPVVKNQGPSKATGGKELYFLASRTVKQRRPEKNLRAVSREKRGAPPGASYDDDRIIAGTGQPPATGGAGLEEVGDMDAVFAPVSAAGLLRRDVPRRPRAFARRVRRVWLRTGARR